MAELDALTKYVDANAIALAGVRASLKDTPLSNVGGQIYTLADSAFKAGFGVSVEDVAMKAAKAGAEEIVKLIGDSAGDLLEAFGSLAEAVPIFQAFWAIAKVALSIADPRGYVAGGGASALDNQVAATDLCARKLIDWYGWPPNKWKGRSITPQEIIAHTLLGETLKLSLCQYIVQPVPKEGDAPEWFTGAWRYTSPKLAAKAEADYRSVCTKWKFEVLKHGSAESIKVANANNYGLSYDRRVLYAQVLRAIEATPPELKADDGATLYMLLCDMMWEDKTAGRLCPSLCNFLCNYSQAGSSSLTASVRRFGLLAPECGNALPAGATFDDLGIAAIPQMFEVIRVWSTIPKPGNAADRVASDEIKLMLANLTTPNRPNRPNRPKVPIMARESAPGGGSAPSESSGNSLLLLAGLGALGYYLTRSK